MWNQDGGGRKEGARGGESQAGKIQDPQNPQDEAIFIIIVAFDTGSAFLPQQKKSILKELKTDILICILCEINWVAELKVCAVGEPRFEIFVDEEQFEIVDEEQFEIKIASARRQS